jgi:hypothetical protein
MAGHGFDVISRSHWGARQPRQRTTRNPATVNTVYIHWPGAASSLRHGGRTIELPTLDELLALAREAEGARADEVPEVLRALRTPEDQVTDCVLPPDLIARTRRIDTAAEERAYVRDIQRFHMDVRLWNDIAYNYLEFRSGRVYAGRTFKVVPASQAPYNTSGVSICCVIGAPDEVSPAMWENLRDFVAWCERYARHDLACKGHRQVNQTTCPGDRLMQLVPRLDRI